MKLLKTAKQNLAKEQEQVEYWNGQVKSTQTTDRYQKLSADIVYRQGLIDAYKEAKQNFEDAKSAAALVAPLQAAYDNANNVLTALKNTLAREQAKLAAMEGEQPAASYTVTPGGETVQPDHTIGKNPSTNVTVQPKGNAAAVSVVNGKAIAAVEGNTQKVSVVSSEWTNGYDAAQAQVAKAQAELKAANQASKVIYISATYTLSDGSTVKADVPVTVLNNVTTNPDEGQTTDNNEGQGSFTGEKDGKYFVKGQQVSAYQYKEYVAAHPSAVKATAKKNAATKATAKKLPQTGNNSAAVVALGALSGMLGLGLAAKKREF
ncbi:LPXTG cell wall anchor domain-containing protein [Limosilactobacillus secaliphilus]|uniref:LPXTG cell wall anchor domain-containing protein n=1 Tax=Limosilactobacillus secaliphilus TaxID=396268 RepID=UPI00138F07A9|nr:LPXTG cell wall anchor domain-containing protein [Limosilactobacillus secaliphilus]